MIFTCQIFTRYSYYFDLRFLTKIDHTYFDNILDQILSRIQQILITLWPDFNHFTTIFPPYFDNTISQGPGQFKTYHISPRFRANFNPISTVFSSYFDKFLTVFRPFSKLTCQCRRPAPLSLKIHSSIRSLWNWAGRNLLHIL